MNTTITDQKRLTFMEEYSRIRCAITMWTEPMTSKADFQIPLSEAVSKKMAP